MEEENKETTTENSAPKKVNPMTFVVVGLFVVLVIGVFMFMSKKQPTPDNQMTESKQMEQGVATEEGSEGTSEAMMEENAMKDSSSPASTDTMVDNTEAASDVIEVKVEGGKFYFKPNTITVKKGQTVKVTFTSVEGLHDFVIDEFSAASEKVQDGQSTTVEFTPDKSGEFEFYCSVGNHRAMGMKGTLIVQ